jgi:hypothetical protein
VPTLADRDGTALLLLHHFHRFLDNPEVVQTAFTQMVAGKQQRTFLVVLAPVVQVPVELEKLFVVLEHALPDREQRERIARELTSDHPEDMPTGDALERVLDAAAGLTRYECEGAFALSLTRHNAIRPEAVWELKAQALAKSGLCSLYRGEPKTFDTLRGVDHIRRLTAQRPSTFSGTMSRKTEGPRRRTSCNQTARGARPRLPSPAARATPAGVAGR